MHTHTAGDGEVVAGDVAGGVRGQEGDGFGDVGGCARAAEERFRLLHTTPSLRAGWLEKRLRFQEDLLPLVTARMTDGDWGGGAAPRARAVVATAFACLDAASMTWVEQDGAGDLMDLYDACLAAVRGRPAATRPPRRRGASDPRQIRQSRIRSAASKRPALRAWMSRTRSTRAP